MEIINLDIYGDNKYAYFMGIINMHIHGDNKFAYSWR